MVSRDDSVLMIGGWCDGTPSCRVAKYTLDKWTEVGNLQSNRFAHRSINNGDRIFVVGGYGN